VAQFGVSDGGSGVLAPAGGGRMQLHNNTTAEAATALAGGAAPATIPFFIYESADKPAEIRKEKSFGDLVSAGGPIALVIVILGAVAIAMLAARTVFLYLSATNTANLVEEIAPLVREGKRDEALSRCKASKGAASRVLASTIRHLDADPTRLEDVISESILHETPFLERFESAITVFAAVAPLLGLLGTVTGMISTFDVITVYGTGDPKLLSGGISEALITTQLGLMVAIPALLFGNFLSGWSDRIKAGMENVALRITNISKGCDPLDLAPGSIPASWSDKKNDKDDGVKEAQPSPVAQGVGSTA
jgi:biopolymer transport protein ExbB